MPEISRFFGIVVAMFYDDHAPPHFHVRYGEYRAIVASQAAKLLGVSQPRISDVVRPGRHRRPSVLPRDGYQPSCPMPMPRAAVRS